MTDNSILYTVTSTNPECYNVIRTNLQVPFGNMCRITATNLTTKATFVLLNKNDYIVVNSTKYTFNDEYGEMQIETLCSLLDSLLENESITSTADNVGRLVMTSAKTFTISDMSYNVKMVSGFYNDTLPLTSTVNEEEKFSLTAGSVGFSLSTPILYLVSNLGAKCYDNIDELYCDRKILMRVSNSFSSGYPIVNSNGEFASIVPVNSLSNIEFRLVDANMHDIKILTPMYLSIQTDTIEDAEEKNS